MAEIGRLIRESNPVPNSKPGYTPQHQLADGSYAITGITNNLPVTDAITQARLNTTIAELQNLKAQLQGIIDGSAPATTQLTGRNVEEIILYNSEAYTSTGNYIKSVDLSKFTIYRFYFVNTHDQDLKLRLQLNNGGLAFDSSGALSQITIPANTTNKTLYAHNALPEPFKVPQHIGTDLLIRVDVAPTSGSFTMVVEGQY